MPALRFVLSMAVVVILVGAASTEEKKATNMEKIVGVWELVKPLPELVTVTKGGSLSWEFTKEGKLIVSVKSGDEDAVPPVTGTYSVDGDKFTTTRKEGSKDVTETITITKLTDMELVMTRKDKDDKTKTMEFKKK